MFEPEPACPTRPQGLSARARSGLGEELGSSGIRGFPGSPAACPHPHSVPEPHPPSFCGHLLGQVRAWALGSGWFRCPTRVLSPALPSLGLFPTCKKESPSFDPPWVLTRVKHEASGLAQGTCTYPSASLRKPPPSPGPCPLPSTPTTAVSAARLAVSSALGSLSTRHRAPCLEAGVGV